MIKIWAWCTESYESCDGKDTLMAKLKAEMEPFHIELVLNLYGDILEMVFRDKDALMLALLRRSEYFPYFIVDGREKELMKALSEEYRIRQAG